MKENNGQHSAPDLREWRRQQITRQLIEHKADAFVTTALPNIRYLTGFTGSNGAVLLAEGRVLLLTDPRYGEQAQAEVDCRFKVARGPLMKAAAGHLKRWKVKRVAIELNRLMLADFGLLRDELAGMKLRPVDKLVETLRMVKSEDEIARIRKSVEVNSAACERALKRLRVDRTEEMELASEIEYQQRRLGADGTAFDSIVAFGAHGAMVHARPEPAPIRRDGLLLIDIGASVAGYASDMTRTFATGKLSATERRMYQAVLESQAAAVEAVRPGATTAAIDRRARDVLQRYGLEKQFVHSTGHGLGLEIHEVPRIGRKESTKLRAGMVITVEPGVYESGVGGVRIEDTVLVTETGYEILTPTSKELTTV